MIDPAELEKYWLHIRTDLGRSFRKRQDVLVRLGNTVPPAVLADSDAEYERLLRAGSTDPVLLIVQPRGRKGYRVSAWLSGAEPHDLFAYTFDAKGWCGAGSSVNSKILIGG